MNDLYTNALVIKGYLLGKEAPAPVLSGIDLIIHHLQAPQVQHEITRDAGAAGAAALALKATELHEAIKAHNEKQGSGRVPVLQADEEESEDDQDVEEMEDEQLQEEAEAPKRKARVTLDDNQKAEACRLYEKEERSVSDIACAFGCSGSNINSILKANGVKMRPSAAQLNAQKKQARLAAEESGEPVEVQEEEQKPATPTPKPRQDTPAERLIEKHSDYAGEREDNTLTREDWGDIRKMRDNGLPEVRIARSYGVELEYLERFIVQMKRQDSMEAEPMGNRSAPAPAGAPAKKSWSLFGNKK